MKKFIGRWLAATAILTVLLVVTGSVMPAVDVERAPGLLPWMLASNALIAACSVGLAALMPWSDAPLAAALFAVLFGVNAFTSLMEAYFFHVLGGQATAFLLAQDGVVYAWFAVAVARLSRSGQSVRRRGRSPERLALRHASAPERLRRWSAFSAGARALGLPIHV